MSRKIDRRDFSADRVTGERAMELERVAQEVSERLPRDHLVRVTRLDHTIGGPRVITSLNAPAQPADFIRRALDHVEHIGPLLGLVRTRPEFIPDDQVRRTASGAVAVHLQQQHDGIPIFQATETVRFNPDGSLRDMA